MSHEDMCPTRTEAEKIALKLAQEIMDKNPCVFNWLPERKAEVGYTELKIVNPDYAFTEKYKYTGLCRTPKTRLAYIIAIKWREDKKYWYQFSIGVDAATGEILGGIMPM